MNFMITNSRFISASSLANFALCMFTSISLVFLLYGSGALLKIPCFQ